MVKAERLRVAQPYFTTFGGDIAKNLIIASP